MLKTDGLRALLEIDMSKKCMLLWRDARFEVEMLKAPHGPLLDVQMSLCVAGTRECAPCQKLPKRQGFVAASNRWQAWGI